MKPEETIAVLAAILAGRRTGDLSDQVQCLEVLLPDVPWADRMALLDPMMSARPTTDLVLAHRQELRELATHYGASLRWRPSTREIFGVGVDPREHHWISDRCSTLLGRSVFVVNGGDIADEDVEL